MKRRAVPVEQALFGGVTAPQVLDANGPHAMVELETISPGTGGTGHSVLITPERAALLASELDALPCVQAAREASSHAERKHRLEAVA